MTKIAGDGNCFFRCVALHVHGDQEMWQQIKDKVLERLEDALTHPELYIHDGNPWSFFAANSSEEFFNATNEKEYLAILQQDGAWGGELEMHIVQKIYGLQFVVFSEGNSGRAAMSFYADDAASTNCIRIHYSSAQGREHYTYLSEVAVVGQKTIGTYDADSKKITLFGDPLDATVTTANSATGAVREEYATRTRRNDVSNILWDTISLKQDRFDFHINGNMREFSIHIRPDQAVKKNGSVTLYVDKHLIAFNNYKSLYHYDILAGYANHSLKRFAFSYSKLSFNARYDHGLYVLIAILVTPCGRRDYAVFMDGRIKIFKEDEYFSSFTPQLDQPFDENIVFEAWTAFAEPMKYNPARHGGK
jgi:hypothetical protein